MVENSASFLVGQMLSVNVQFRMQHAFYNSKLPASMRRKPALFFEIHGRTFFFSLMVERGELTK